MNLILTDNYAELSCYQKNPLAVMRSELARVERALSSETRKARAFADCLKGFQCFVHIDVMPRLNSKTEVLQTALEEIRFALMDEISRLEMIAHSKLQSGFKSVRLNLIVLGKTLRSLWEKLRDETFEIIYAFNQRPNSRTHNTYLNKWLELAHSYALHAVTETDGLMRGYKMSDPNINVITYHDEPYFHPNKNDAQRFPHIAGIPDVRFVRTRLDRILCAYEDLQGYYIPISHVFWLDTSFNNVFDSGYQLLPDLDYIRKRFNF